MPERITALSAKLGSAYRTLRVGAQFAAEAVKELHLVRSRRDLQALAEKWRYVYPRLSKRYIKGTVVPPSLQLEPTNLCNVRCVCCPSSRSKRRKGFIDYDLFVRIVEEAAEVGVKRIYLYLHGEPMLHPRIEDMLSHIKKHGLSVSLTTNGTLLTSERIGVLLRCGLTLSDHITISMLGNSTEVHEGIMRGLSRARVVESIKEFVRTRDSSRKAGPVVATMFYTMPENWYERNAYTKFWSGIVDHAQVGGTISESFRNACLPEVAIPVRRSTCQNLWERMTVYWNGQVTVCCEDVDETQVVGDLHESSIPEIWNCDKLTTIRELHRRGEFSEYPFCYHCDM